MKRKGIFLFFILFFVIMAAARPLYRETSGSVKKEPEKAEEELSGKLHAKYAVLLDGDSGRVLFGKNEASGAAMASTTKIMTCIVALEAVSKPQVCVMSPYASGRPKVHLSVRAGERLAFEDLLYSMMLESHNDSAACVAENIGAALLGEVVEADTDSQKSSRYIGAFLEKMNQKAEEIGCKDTYFLTPNGLDEEKDGKYHHSTAEDMAKILRYCIYQSPEREAFLEVTQTQDHTFSNEDGTRSFGCHNHNQLFTIFDSAVSGKTGFTNKAGYCYVGAVESGGKKLIAAVLACGWPSNKSYKWEDMKKLVSYGTENYERADLSEIPSREGKVIVDNAKHSLNVPKMSISVKNEKISYFFLKKPEEKIETKIVIPQNIEAPVEKGQTVGSISYYLGDEKLASASMKAAGSAEKINFWWCLRVVAKKIVI